MWYFEWFTTQFGYIEKKFDAVADNIKNIPYIGDNLSYPFKVWAVYFRNLETASKAADTWSDTVFTGISDFWSDLKDDIEDEWDILTKTYVEIVNSGKSAILGTYTSVELWLAAQEALVKSWILGTYTTIDHWLAAQEALVKGWILGTYTSLDDYFNAYLTALFSLGEDGIEGFDDWLEEKLDTVKDDILGIYLSLDLYLDEQKDKILNWIIDDVETFLDKITDKI